LLLPPVVGDVDERPDGAPEGSRVPMGARRVVPAAKASGRYRFGEGIFPRIPGNDGEAPKTDYPDKRDRIARIDEPVIQGRAARGSGGNCNR
jgi:hypothetical protein